MSPILKFDPNMAFWVQNQVSNFVYYRYRDTYPIVRHKIDELQADLLELVNVVDANALQAYNNDGAEKAVSYVSLFTVNAGNTVQKLWQEFYGELFVTFRDFYTILPKEDDPACGCEAKQPGLSEAMKKRIIEETGEHYKVIENADDVPVLRGESGRTSLPSQSFVDDAQLAEQRD